jgi:thiamine biosynthesis lipoprotein
MVSCASPRAQESTVNRFEYQRPQMGVEFRLILYAPDKPAADAAAEAAFNRVKELNDIMSDYDPESELSRLSRTSGQGKVVKVSDDLWYVLKRSQELAEQSEGAFDVTVGPCVLLWRKARREHKLPDHDRLEQARQSVGYRKMRLDPKKHTVELLAPNMRLDLGGIAKGYAVDEALCVLKEKRINRALLEGGGDFKVSDPPPGRKGWRIQVAPLDMTNAPPVRFLSLANAAISTSGDLYQRLEIDGKRYSHIIDPHTCIGLTDHSLVNIIAPDSITADSLTKVVSVLGPEKGMKFVHSWRNVFARVMRNPGEKIEVYESPGFAKFYEKD